MRGHLSTEGFHDLSNRDVLKTPLSALRFLDYVLVACPRHKSPRRSQQIWPHTVKLGDEGGEAYDVAMPPPSPAQLPKNDGFVDVLILISKRPS